MQILLVEKRKIQTINMYRFTFSEYAASVSQIENPATPCSNQNRSACCRDIKF